VFVGRLSEAVLGEPAHRHQLTRERRPLGLLGIAHGLKQLRVTTSFEHIFDASARTDIPPPPDPNLWTNSGLGITSRSSPELSVPSRSAAPSGRYQRLIVAWRPLARPSVALRIRR
jgi:hypothetical protein